MDNRAKRKADRQNLYVTVTVILMMVAVVVAIAVSLAKNPAEAPKPPEEAESDTVKDSGFADEEPLETEDVFLRGDETEAVDDETGELPEDTDVSRDTEGAEDGTDVDADADADASVLPQFIAPVRGEVIRDCSLEVPVFSLTMEDYRTHTGVDLYCEQGGDVACIARGRIKEIWDDPMMGTCISVEHAGGAVSVYKNLCEDIPDGIEAGLAVDAGRIIGSVGNTALIELAEESHLHLELYINGVAADPAEYIDFSSSSVFAEG
ncbi:MAG: M23 family metallopeptidase [Clostridia bacterium]|nr:M23 family metallopeptidase [Clostridia bacterium]